MKRINWALVIALIFFGFAIAYYVHHMEEPPVEKETPPRTNVKSVRPLPKQREEIMVNGRKIIGKVTEEQRKNPELIKPANIPSPAWKKEVLHSLEKLGGDEVKTVSIKKVESVVWMKNEGGINAESVIITLKNKEGMESSFRALVDAQTGRILETWDRTIFEPVGHQEGLIQLDERYFE